MNMTFGRPATARWLRSSLAAGDPAMHPAVRRVLRPELVGACMGLLITACGGLSLPSELARPSASRSVLALPTTGPLDACAGVQFDGPFILKIEDGATVAHRAVGTSLPILWPNNFTARFDGAIWRVFDARGKVFASSGEDISDYLKGNWHGWSVCTTTRAVYLYGP